MSKDKMSGQKTIKKGLCDVEGEKVTVEPGSSLSEVHLIRSSPCSATWHHPKKKKKPGPETKDSNDCYLLDRRRAGNHKILKKWFIKVVTE